MIQEYSTFGLTKEYIEENGLIEQEERFLRLEKGIYIFGTLLAIGFFVVGIYRELTQ